MRDYAFGNFIRELRLEKGLSQAQLGEACGVSNKAVSKWENGASKPSMDTLRRLADLFGVTTEELLAGRRRAPTESADDFERVMAVRSEISAPMVAYFKWSLIGTCMTLLIGCMAILLLPVWWLKISVFLLLLIGAKLFVRAVANRYIHRILYEELDPVKYAQAVFTLQPPASVHLSAAIYAGDYARAINICHAGLKTAKNSSVTRSYLALLARVYFLCGDREGLADACKRFEATLPVDPVAAEKIRKIWPAFGFYRAFLAGDFAACRTYCTTAREKLDRRPRARSYRLAAVNNDFTRAVVLYHMGDAEREASMAEFSAVIKAGPKLHLATLARQYMDGVFAPVVLVPDADYEIFDAATLRAVRKRRIIRRLLILVTLLCLMLQPVIADATRRADEREAQAAWEAEMKQIVALQDASYTLVDHLTVVRAGKVVDVLCIAVRGDVVDVWSYCRDNEVNYVLPRCLGMVMGETQKKTLLDGTPAEFCLYETEADIPDGVTLTKKLTSNGRTRYLCVTCSV